MSPRSNDAGSVARLQNGTHSCLTSSRLRLLDVERHETVTGARRSEARELHCVEVDRVGAPAVVVAPVREARTRSTVVAQGLAKPNRRPASATACADPITEEDPIAFDVDRDPLEYPAATTADERERGRGAEVVEGIFSHRHRAETVANTALSTWDGAPNGNQRHEWTQNPTALTPLVPSVQCTLGLSCEKTPFGLS
jgi:hypothetical protein